MPWLISDSTKLQGLSILCDREKWRICAKVCCCRCCCCRRRGICLCRSSVRDRDRIYTKTHVVSIQFTILAWIWERPLWCFFPTLATLHIVLVSFSNLFVCFISSERFWETIPPSNSRLYVWCLTLYCWCSWTTTWTPRRSPEKLTDSLVRIWLHCARKPRCR